MSDYIFFPFLIVVDIAALVAARHAKSPATQLAARYLLNMLLVVALVLLLKTVLEVAASG
jgi:hypothetical protein